MDLTSLLPSGATTTHLLLMYVAMQLSSAVVQSLPQPSEYGGIWYKSFYNFLSILVTDFKSFREAQKGTGSTSTTTVLTSETVGVSSSASSTAK